MKFPGQPSPVKVLQLLLGALVNAAEGSHECPACGVLDSEHGESCWLGKAIGLDGAEEAEWIAGLIGGGQVLHQSAHDVLEAAKKHNEEPGNDNIAEDLDNTINVWGMDGYPDMESDPRSGDRDDPSEIDGPPRPRSSQSAEDRIDGLESDLLGHGLRLAAVEARPATSPEAWADINANSRAIAAIRTDLAEARLALGMSPESISLPIASESPADWPIEATTPGLPITSEDDPIVAPFDRHDRRTHRPDCDCPYCAIPF